MISHPLDLEEIVMHRNLAIAGLLVLVLGFGVLVRSARAATNDRWIVRLYAGSQVVGTWQALDAGRVDGDSLVFRIDGGVEERVVRIQGTYSVEPTKR